MKWAFILWFQFRLPLPIIIPTSWRFLFPRQAFSLFNVLSAYLTLDDAGSPRSGWFRGLYVEQTWVLTAVDTDKGWTIIEVLQKKQQKIEFRNNNRKPHYCCDTICESCIFLLIFRYQFPTAPTDDSFLSLVYVTQIQIRSILRREILIVNWLHGEIWWLIRCQIRHLWRRHSNCNNSKLYDSLS